MEGHYIETWHFHWWGDHFNLYQLLLLKCLDISLLGWVVQPRSTALWVVLKIHAFILEMFVEVCRVLETGE